MRQRAGGGHEGSGREVRQPVREGKVDEEAQGGAVERRAGAARLRQGLGYAASGRTARRRHTPAAAVSQQGTDSIDKTYQGYKPDYQYSHIGL